MSGPTPEDIDNFHRLCSDFSVLKPSFIADLFKKCEFDYQKARCILRGKVEEQEDNEDPLLPEEIDPFNEDDMNAYIDQPDVGDANYVKYLTAQYIATGKIQEDPQDPESKRDIMPDELDAIESSSSCSDVLPNTSAICRNWLKAGFCEEEETKQCPCLHTLYGVVCDKKSLCLKRSQCPFVHNTIANQCLSARENFGMELLRPDEPKPKFAKAEAEAFDKAKCPTMDQLKAAFPSESFPEDLASVDPCYWPEKETDYDKKVARDLEADDKAAGERVLIGEDSFEDFTVKYYGISGLWAAKIPFLEMFRAYYNEMQIHGRMRKFHLDAAVKCKGDEAKEHLRLARIHYNRERYLGRESDTIFLHMGNSRYGSFSDSNEHVLYLYGTTVTEARDILKQLFDGATRKQHKFYVFAMESREKYFHFVTLDDIRKYCDAKGLTCINHGEVLEFVY